jgi:hypothetical protein
LQIESSITTAAALKFLVVGSHEALGPGELLKVSEFDWRVSHL